LIANVSARYAEPHRHYHTLTHLEACLDAVREIWRPSPEVELALLFHDAIYDPRAHDNEAASVSLMCDEGQRAGLDAALLERATPLILATRHTRTEGLSDEAGWVVDADLSILGADPATFQRYEQEVRREYGHVDDAAFSAGRRAFVRGLLAREALFATTAGRARWEAQARRNLEASVGRWSCPRVLARTDVVCLPSRPGASADSRDHRWRPVRP
jgi:predicted metal-dependent HD superfamily phosphohydrolase